MAYTGRLASSSEEELFVFNDTIGGSGVREGWRGGESNRKRREGSGSDLDGRV
jgi:hypothetical protein